MPDFVENDRSNINEFMFPLPGTTTTTTTFEDDDITYQSSTLLELNPITRFLSRRIRHVQAATELPALLEVLGCFLSKSLIGRASIAPLLDPATASLLENVSTTAGIIEHNVELISYRNRFKLTLLSELDAEPVEDGIRHNAEQLINNAAAGLPDLIPQWIEELFSEMLTEGRMTDAAGLLQCLGRTRSSAIRPIGRNLVARALTQRSVEVREAAVTIVEQWGGEDLIQLLREYTDPVPWLRKYIEKVRQELS